jgi:hypothetical protein
MICCRRSSEIVIWRTDRSEARESWVVGGAILFYSREGTPLDRGALSFLLPGECDCE